MPGAIDVNRAEPDYSLHVNDAAGLAATNGLDFLELVAGDGAIVSSAKWPAPHPARTESDGNGGAWSKL